MSCVCYHDSSLRVRPYRRPPFQCESKWHSLIPSLSLCCQSLSLSPKKNSQVEGRSFRLQSLGDYAVLIAETSPSDMRLNGAVSSVSPWLKGCMSPVLQSFAGLNSNTSGGRSMATGKKGKPMLRASIVRDIETRYGLNSVPKLPQDRFIHEVYPEAKCTRYLT
jgi:hypothetical protein